MELGALIIHHKPFSELILKRILLLFDYVCIVNPEQNEQLIPRGTPQVDFHVLKYDREYAYFYKGRSYSATENELLYKYNKLIDEGLVRVLNLVDDGFYLHNWLPLRLSFDYDTANPEFAKLFKPLFENQPVIQPGDTVLPGCIVRDEMINLFMPNSYPKLPSPTVIYDADDEYDVGNFHDHQLYSVIGRLNKLVMVSSEYNLVSVFLDNNIVNGFNEKFRIAKANNEIKHSWYQAFGSNSINLQNLIFKISNSLISDELLSRISVEELLTIRNGTTQNLARLRRNLTQSVAFLQTSYSDSGALNARELDDFINNKFIKNKTIVRKSGFYALGN